MKVFIVYERGGPLVLRVSARSWESRGWTIRLLLPGALPPTNGIVINPRLVNYGIRPREWDRLKRSTRKFGTRGWKTSRLVQFPVGTTDTDILECGRSL